MPINIFATGSPLLLWPYLVSQTQVTDTASFWEWIEGNLITGLYDATWYNGRQFEYKEGYISNHEEFMIGMPRLRQLRLKLSKNYKNFIAAVMTKLLHSKIYSAVFWIKMPLMSYSPYFLWRI